jgi:predicted O-methyltransferase YrrM
VESADICAIAPLYDCVVVSLAESDWARRISFGWELLEPGGLLMLTDTKLPPDASDDLLNEFIKTRAAVATGIEVGEGVAMAYKMMPDCPEPPETPSEHSIVGVRAARVLDELRTKNLIPGSRLLAIPPETGRFLWTLLSAMKARRVLEIGSSSGYSGIWLASALGRTGGKLTTIEADPDKVALATESYRRAGVADWVAMIQGDARDIVDELDGEFDFIFLDCEKSHYLELLDHLVSLVRPGGLIVSDNVISHRQDLKLFIEAVQHHSNLASVTVGIGSGEEMTIRL